MAIIPHRLPSGARDYSRATSNGTQVRLVLEGHEAQPAPRIKLRPILAPVIRIPVRYNPVLNGTEAAVLQWMAFGKKYDEIAELMEMTSNAVYQHSHRIYDKLGTSTAPGAVAIALRRGIIK